MTQTRRRQSPQRLQQGVVLFIALILLVALTLSGLALFRQVGTGVLVARNLTFNSAALIAADLGAETARNWLVNSGANLQNASLTPAAAPPTAYFPAWCNTTLDASSRPDADGNGVIDDCKATPPPSEFNPLTYNWANSALVTNDDGNGNAVRYVIHRLCRIPGSLNFTNSDGVPQECVSVGSASTGGESGVVDYTNVSLKSTMQPYFRVTTRTTGPNNTVTYSQIILY